MNCQDGRCPPLEPRSEHGIDGCRSPSGSLLKVDKGWAQTGYFQKYSEYGVRAPELHQPNSRPARQSALLPDLGLEARPIAKERHRHVPGQGICIVPAVLGKVRRKDNRRAHQLLHGPTRALDIRVRCPLAENSAKAAMTQGAVEMQHSTRSRTSDRPVMLSTASAPQLAVESTGKGMRLGGSNGRPPGLCGLQRTVRHWRWQGRSPQTCPSLDTRR